MNKTEKFEVIIIIILIAVFGGTLIYARGVDKEVREEAIDSTVTPLKEVNRYFSIDSAISKYVSYVVSKDMSSIMKVLNKDFVTDNQITEENIFDYITEYGSNYRSNTREIYQVSSYNNIYKYYAKVRISEENLYNSNIVGYNYFEVTIDEDNLTFALEPISEIMYQEKIEEATSNE